MSSFIYKCPNCDSGLVFDPGRQWFWCEYCRSGFNEQELSAEVSTGNTGSLKEVIRQEPGDFETRALGYACPACGAEIITDDTTAATSCVYCRNPVILTGRLKGGLKPDKVIPFKFDKEAVRERLQAWLKSRFFIDRSFYQEALTREISGVYIPFWVVDGQAEGLLEASGEKIRTWRSGDTEYRESSIYKVTRNGRVSFENLALKALNKKNTRLISGIYPYDTTQALDFSMPYLSGFLAEKRNLEQKDLISEAITLIHEAGEKLLKNSAAEYHNLTVTSLTVSSKEQNWRYSLMPVWLLTLEFKGENYYFAMNGQTGKVAGRVPAGRNKLMIFGGLIALASGLAAAFLGGFL